MTVLDLDYLKGNPVFQCEMAIVVVVILPDKKAKRGRIKASKGTARNSQGSVKKRNGIRPGWDKVWRSYSKIKGTWLSSVIQFGLINTCCLKSGSDSNVLNMWSEIWPETIYSQWSSVVWLTTE